MCHVAVALSNSPVMFSELVIAATLLVNACAVLNFKLKPNTQLGFIDPDSKSAGDRIREFLHSLQYFRIFIALWNVFVLFLLVV